MIDDPKEDEKLDRLFAEARKAELYDPKIEYGFETRVMARVRMEREGRMPLLLWAWRLVPVFLSVVILLGIWTYVSTPDQRIDLSAVAGIGNEETMLTAYLTGE